MIFLALDLALARAGNSMPARIAMMAMTTNNSINVNPRALVCRFQTSLADFVFFINFLPFDYSKKPFAMPLAFSAY